MPTNSALRRLRWDGYRSRVNLIHIDFWANFSRYLGPILFPSTPSRAGKIGEPVTMPTTKPGDLGLSPRTQRVRRQN